MHSVSTSLRAKVKFTLGVVALCSLAACGGGGGGGNGGDGANGQPQAPAQVPAESDHLTLVNGNYFGAVQEVLASDAKFQSSGSDATSVFGVDAAPTASAVEQVQGLVSQMDARLRTGPSMVTGVTSSETQACSVSGNFVATVDDSNANNQLDAGDKMTVVMNNCNAGKGTVSGTLGLSINALTGDLGTSFYKLDASAAFGSIKTVGSTESQVMDGTTRMVIESKSDAYKQTSVSTESFKTSGSLGGVAYSRVFTNYTSVHLRQVEMYVGATETVTINGALTSSILNGKIVEITTPATLGFTRDKLNFGMLDVAGAFNSKARLALDVSARSAISLDADGDGKFEVSTPVIWSSVRP